MVVVNLAEIMVLLEEMAAINTGETEVLKIKYLLREYNQGFYLVQKGKFLDARSTFVRADAILRNQFDSKGFEYCFTQLFAVSAKAYLEFKLKNKDQAIELTKKGIDYAILLQDAKSSENIMGLFISQMLMNLAKIHLLSKEVQEWRDITLENIDFLLNFSTPRFCEGFEMINLKEASTYLRYSKFISLLNEVLECMHKFKVEEGHQLIQDIEIMDASDEIIALVDSWIRLNTSINQHAPRTVHFDADLTKFLESSPEKYDLGVLKEYLEQRVQQQERDLHAIA